MTGTGVYAIQLTITRLVRSRLAGELLVWRKIVCVVTRLDQIACAIRCVMARWTSIRERVKDVHDAIVVIVSLAHQGVPTRAKVHVGRDIAIHVLSQSQGTFLMMPPAVNGCVCRHCTRVCESCRDLSKGQADRHGYADRRRTVVRGSVAKLSLFVEAPAGSAAVIQYCTGVINAHVYGYSGPSKGK